MATCYQKHPFQVGTEDRLTEINTKIFEIKKKIQLSEGQRKSYYEENEQEKRLNNDLIETLKQEIKLRLDDLKQAREVIGEEEIQIKKYLNDVCPIGNKNSDQIIHNLDLKVIEQRKILDLLKYDRKNKKSKLRKLEKDYEQLLIENSKGELVKSKINSAAKKNISHLENEIHKVLIQWTEAELVKKKYLQIRQALIDDSVKFESSLSNVEELLQKQREEIRKLEYVREEAAVMRMKASVATTAEAARAHDADQARADQRAYFAQRFDDRKRELEKLEKRIFPPAPRVVRTESARSTNGDVAADETNAAQQMEEVFQRLMKLTGVTEPEEVFDRFRGQRETSKRLSYLQQTTEEEKLKLEETQTTLMAELEAFKFASVKDKDEGQDQINSLKEEIKEEEARHAELVKKLEDLETLLMDIKRLLFDICKLLDVIPQPQAPEWTADARDVHDLLDVISVRYDTARVKVADIRGKRDNSVMVAFPSNPPSGAASVANVSVHTSMTPKDVEKLPTYKELIIKEPVRPPHKNSYLQLVCAMNPRVINTAVDNAMERTTFDWRTEKPNGPRLESMQPSLYAPHVDITRARLGFCRVGLRIINRDLHSEEHFRQLQALHSVLDQVQISESALFLINLHVVYRLIDLMLNRDPIIREKVCLCLMHLATYYQGRQRIMSRPKIIENLMWLTMRDRKEIRYAAANTLRTLARDRCACEMILKNETIVEDLLKMIKHDYTGIVLLHLKTFEALTEWDPARPLKANAFQVMLTLFDDVDPRIIAHAMDCMAQLCKHEVGKKLADNYDLTFVLRKFLVHEDIEVIISAVGLMAYTTITTRSKWRAKEACNELTKRLVALCHNFNKPQLQLKCIQVLINLCDCPDMRYHVKFYWEKKVKAIKIRTHEEWDGTSETTSYGLETGHNYRTMCIEPVETIKNDFGDLPHVNPHVISVHSYIRRLQEKKDQLIAAINWKSWRD